MYEVINKELGIKACSIGDLTAEQVKHFLNLWEKGAKIGELSLFIEDWTGDVVLNKDSKMYETNLEMAELYLSSSEDKRKELLEKCPKSMKETVSVLRNSIFSREIAMVSKNCIEDKKQRETINMIEKQYSGYAAGMVFLYGLICGKRIERQKRKRQSENA